MTEDPLVASRYTSDKIHLPATTFGRVTTQTRQKAAERGEAMSDGSFPIRDKKDLQRAIQAYGRAKDKAAAKRHIIRRARALEQVDLLPNAWKELATREFSHTQQPVPDAITAASRNSLSAKIARHNAQVSEDAKVCEAQARVVYKRGLADYSTTFALGPEQAAQARVNAFLRLVKNGRPDSSEYTVDNDLLPSTHPMAPPPFPGSGFVAAGRSYPWVEADHPRDGDGKFIEKLGRLKWRDPGSSEWQAGKAIGYEADTFWIEKDDGSVHEVPIDRTKYTKAVARLRPVSTAPKAPTEVPATPELDDIDEPILSAMRPATPEDRKRLKIPPGWTDVFVAVDPNAPLQAKGLDSKGRTQPRYSDAHKKAAAEKKFARMKALHEVMPTLEYALARDAKSDGTAASVMLSRKMGIRNGSETDTGADTFAYGASNLRAKHVLVDGDKMTLDFDAKDNVRLTFEVTDPEMKDVIRTHLGAKTGDDSLFDTNEIRTRAYLKSQIGDEFLVKDLRTYRANEEALAAIATMPMPTSETEFKKSRRAVAVAVSTVLGNTVSVALTSYINPAVFSKWELALSESAPAAPGGAVQSPGIVV